MEELPATAEIRQLRAELNEQFAAVHERLNELNGGQQRIKRELTTVSDSISWQGVINEAIFCAVCVGLSITAVSLDAIHANVCPKIPGWLYPVIPFNFILCPQSSSSTATNNAVDRPEIMAFLDSLAWAEGTGDDYNIQYTFARFSDYSHHPAEIKCSGSLCSDAAGRYQYLSTTWSNVATKLGLTDFSPASQDKAAIETLKDAGAYDLILAGDIAGAVNAVRRIWASLPGSGHGQRERPLSEFLKVYQEKLAARKTQAVVPVSSGKAFPLPGMSMQSATVTSPYGMRSHPVKGIPMMHYGLDLAANEGTPVLATELGVIKQTSENDGDCGKTVWVDFQDGRGMRVCHLSRIDVQQGQQVQAGQTIGAVGSTGGVTGPHLHFEFVQNGASVDPTAYLQSLGSIQPAQKPIVAAAPQPAVSNSASVPAAFVGIKLNDGLLCSGFAVAADRIVTANHCIESQTATVVPQSGEWLQGKVIKQDAGADLALIQVDGANFSPISIASSLPAVDAELVSFGHPQGGSTIAASTVKVTGSSGDKITAAPVSEQKVLPGFSGGPVLSSGTLAGMNDEANQAGAARIVPATAIQKFIGQ